MEIPGKLPAQDKARSKVLLSRISALVDELNTDSQNPIKIMHVCGTHEYTVSKYGLRSILPGGLEVIAGPGCPVCICPAQDVKLGLEIAKEDNVILATFGDMIRVPAEGMTLGKLRGEGADIRVVYGPNDAVQLAKNNPDKEVVFFSIGFETTVPLAAYELSNNPPSNFSIIGANRLVPPALDALLQLEDVPLAGFLLPGHVSAIIGVDGYLPLENKYHSPMVIGGFEINDVLISLLMLLLQLKEQRGTIENAYQRVVKKEGNKKAWEIVHQVFEVADGVWRGIGTIPDSALVLRSEYQQYDARLRFKKKIPEVQEIPPGCKCHLIILGKDLPQNCPLFGKTCVPENPIGPCMVSHEGTCRIAHIFRSI